MSREPLHITVDQRGLGDYQTLQEAVQAAPYSVETIIHIHSGIYREKVFCEKKRITLQGDGFENTVLRWGDGAFFPHADGRPNGTFRSYTLFLGGGSVKLCGMTIENDAGSGASAGQAMAVYADAACIWMENVALISHQDTLFCAPLPEKERLPDGFLGPRQLAPRRASRQYYRHCTIAGDIDFIFGGADAVFDGCCIVSRDRGETVNGYIAAPSGKADGLGFVFRRCHMTSPAQPETVYLARPWRSHGRATLLHCRLEAHIKPTGWDDWQDEANQQTAFFAEYQSIGPGSMAPGQSPCRAAWAHALTPEQARQLDLRADELIDSVEKSFTDDE